MSPARGQHGLQHFGSRTITSVLCTTFDQTLLPSSHNRVSTCPSLIVLSDVLLRYKPSSHIGH